MLGSRLFDIPTADLPLQITNLSDDDPSLRKSQQPLVQNNTHRVSRFNENNSVTSQFRQIMRYSSAHQAILITLPMLALAIFQPVDRKFSLWHLTGISALLKEAMLFMMTLQSVSQIVCLLTLIERA